jgi:hypothetical protein
VGELRRKYGFWGTLGSFELRQFVSPEFVLGPLLGGGGAWFLLAKGTEQSRIEVAGDYLSLTGALLGVVFAAFALVIAFLSDSYLRALRDTSSGVLGFLRPFMFSTGLLVGVVLGTVAYRGAAPYAPGWLEATVFIVLSILFVTAVLDVVALARSVLMHGIARSQTVSTDGVSPMEPRRDGRRRS